MKKTIFWIFGIVVVLALIVAVAGFIKFNFSDKDIHVAPVVIPVSDYKNATYLIDGKEVTLTNGLSEQEISSSSASKIVTRFFGNEAEGYYNNDKVKDIAFLLTQNTGGSGTFYYLAVALGAGDGFVGTNTILLGDRIAPQNTSFRDWQIVVNYAERKPGEPFTTRPSLGVSRYFKVVDNKLVEVKK